MEKMDKDEGNRKDEDPRMVSLDADSNEDAGPLGMTGIEAKINSETATIPFADLMIWYAKGLLIWVDPAEDLVKVVAAMANNDVSEVQKLIEAGKISKLMDDVAKRWHEDKMEVWATVVKPYIVVQEPVQART